MGVHADEASDVGLVTSTQGVMTLEETVEESDGFVLASYMLDPRIDVVRHIGAILPAVGLGEVVVDFGGVEGSEPAAVALGVGKAVAVDDVLSTAR